MTSLHFAYIGWPGRGNLGDDAILESVEQAFPDAMFEEVSMYPSRLLTAARSGRLRHLRDAAPFITGGTAIGRMNWRVELRLAMLLARRRPAVMLGAGVEDPSFQGDHGFSGTLRTELTGMLSRRLPGAPGSYFRGRYLSMRDNTAGAELRQWRPVLREFLTVAVRGPRSAELLADVGVEAEVVGDPALLLQPTGELPPHQEKIVGVTLGYGDDLWGHDHERVVNEVGDALRALTADGWHARFIVVNESDRRFVAPCAAAAGIDSADVVDGITTDDFFREAAKCDVFVGERLHSTILASVIGVPSVMIEYQPKCLDFMRSIGREEWNLRTDHITGRQLREQVIALHDDRSTHVDDIESSVSVLRGRLEEEVARIKSAF